MKINESNFNKIADEVIDEYVTVASTNLIGKMPVGEIETAMKENKVVFKQLINLLLRALEENEDWYGN